MRRQGQSFREKRLLFHPGKQREFISTVKEGTNSTWEDLGNQLKVSAHTLSYEWNREKATLPKNIAVNYHGLKPVASRHRLPA